MTKPKIDADTILKIKVAAVIVVIIAFVSDVALCEKKAEDLEIRNQSSAKQFFKGGNDTLYGYDRAPVMSSGSMK